MTTTRVEGIREEGGKRRELSDGSEPGDMRTQCDSSPRDVKRTLTRTVPLRNGLYLIKIYDIEPCLRSRNKLLCLMNSLLSEKFSSYRNPYETLKMSSGIEH